MRSTQQMSITLPTEMAEVVKSKVAAGEYASESEVIRDGLRALMAREKAIDQWLKKQVGSAYDALVADPKRGVSIKAMRESLKVQHERAVSRAGAKKA